MIYEISSLLSRLSLVRGITLWVGRLNQHPCPKDSHWNRTRYGEPVLLLAKTATSACFFSVQVSSNEINKVTPT